MPMATAAVGEQWVEVASARSRSAKAPPIKRTMAATEQHEQTG